MLKRDENERASSSELKSLIESSNNQPETIRDLTSTEYLSVNNTSNESNLNEIRKEMNKIQAILDFIKCKRYLK